MSKKEMIKGLLQAFDYAIRAGSPDECARQFVIWQNHVASALMSAGMAEELKAWLQAKESTDFYADDPSFPAQAESMKAILVGILDKLEESEPLAELFPMEIVNGTRPYIEKIAIQANGCYQRGWFDACAVMVRRLIEVLIIDCFEQHNIASKITNLSGDYYGLRDLIVPFLNETTWHVPKTLRTHLPRLKDLKEIGDASAHGRHLATRKQIDDLSTAIAYSFQGLAEIAYFQNR